MRGPDSEFRSSSVHNCVLYQQCLCGRIDDRTMWSARVLRAEGKLGRSFLPQRLGMSRSPVGPQVVPCAQNLSINSITSAFTSNISRHRHADVLSSRSSLDRVARENTAMAAIGSLVFCTDCGNLLEPNTGRKAYIQCDLCGMQNKGTQNDTTNTYESVL